MANLFFGINGPTMNLHVEMKVQDTDAPRIISYLHSTHYGQITAYDPNTGEPIIKSSTNEEVVYKFAEGVLNSLLQQTVNYEKQLAMENAASQIQTIVPIKE